jgi:hypothetical protein
LSFMISGWFASRRSVSGVPVKGLCHPRYEPAGRGHPGWFNAARITNRFLPRCWSRACQPRRGIQSPGARARTLNLHRALLPCVYASPPQSVAVPGPANPPIGRNGTPQTRSLRCGKRSLLPWPEN